MVELPVDLVVKAMPEIRHNVTDRTVTLTCVEESTGQEFSIEFGSGVCESLLAMLSLAAKQSGPFPYRISNRKPRPKPR